MPEAQVPFDSVADSYDGDAACTAAQAQRQAVHAYLQRHVLRERRTLRVLELGCGTGIDALWFAAQGHSVVATDGSARMLEMLARKAAAANLAGRIRTRQLDLQRLSSTLDDDAPFDLVFSNFGVLNCLAPEHLSPLGAWLAPRLAPRGDIVIVAMPRFCLWEFAFFVAKLRWSDATRRWRRGPLLARVGPGLVPTWYHPFADLRRRVAPTHAWHRARPIGLLVPPWYLDRLVPPRITAWLARMDAALSALPGTAPLADHALLHAWRMPSVAS